MSRHLTTYPLREVLTDLDPSRPLRMRDLRDWLGCSSVVALRLCRELVLRGVLVPLRREWRTRVYRVDPYYLTLARAWWCL